jgi:hypothetical protein
MKVLRSGVQLTESELKKIKGGKACACGCGVGYDSQQLAYSGGNGCLCGCTSGGSSWDSNSHAALINA